MGPVRTYILAKKTFDINNAGTITLRLFTFCYLLGSDF